MRQTAVVGRFFYVRFYINFCFDKYFLLLLFKITINFVSKFNYFHNIFKSFRIFHFRFRQNIPQLFQNFQSISDSIIVKQTATFSEFSTDLSFICCKTFLNILRIFSRFQFQFPQNITQLLHKFQPTSVLISAKYYANF